MSRWIKPSELPNNFWEEVFCVIKSKYVEGKIRGPEIMMVRKERGKIQHHNSCDGRWYDVDDEQYRLMLINYPKYEGAFD